MTPKNKAIFKIRNRFYEIIDSGPKSAIIRGIIKGKFSKDDEFSLPPYFEWQKLISHPDFYEAFMKKTLLGKVDYKFRDEDKEPNGEANNKNSLSQKVDKVEEKRENESNNAHQTDIIALLEHESIDNKANSEKINKIEIEPETQLPEKRKFFSKQFLILLGIISFILIIFTFFSKNNEVDSKSEKKVDSQIGQILSSITPIPIDLLIADALELSEIHSIPFLEGALRILEEATTFAENNVKVLVAIAEVKSRLLMLQPQKKELEKDIRTVIENGRKIEPHNTGFYQAETITALAMNDLVEARKKMSLSIETDPRGIKNLLLLAELKYASGEFSEAITNLKYFLDKEKKNVRGRILLAKCALELNELSKAENYLKDILEEYPFYAEARLMLGELMHKINQLDEAKKNYNYSGQLAKLLTKKEVAKAYFNLGKIEESLNDVNYKNSYKLAYYYGSQFFPELKNKLKGDHISKRILRKLALSHELDSSDFIEYGKKLLKDKQYKMAGQYFLLGHLLEPNNVESLVLYGKAIEEDAYSDDEIQKTKLVYRRAILLDSSNWHAYFRLGLLETNQLNLDQGLIYLKRAQQLAPRKSEVYVGLASHFMKRQDYVEALNYLAEARNLDPANPEVLFYAGKIGLIVKKDDYKDTMNVFQQVYSIDSNNYEALKEWLKLKVKNYEKNFAVKFIRELISKEPQNPNYYWVLGEVYAANNEHFRAINYYHKALNINNKLSKVRMSLAASLEATGDLLKATAEYRLASILDKKNKEGFFKAAELCYKIKDYMTAEKLFNNLLEISPNYPGVHRYLSMLNEEKGIKNKAIEEMEKEVAINPENNKYLLDLATLYLKFEMYEKAEKELQKITQLPPISKKAEFVFDKIRAYLLLSRVYRAQNRLENAEAAINMAIAIDNKDPELRKERGFVYYMQERDQEGVQEFELYLKLKPEATDANVIKALIGKMKIEK